MDNVEVDKSPNYRTVKELLFDEEKIVTYLTVAKELCIHVNEAKYLMKQMLEDIRKESNTQLNVNYIVSGICDDNSAQTIVCSEGDLSTKKKLFRGILFEHIYSINQGKNGVDSAAIVSLNKFEDFPLCPGLIKSSFCLRRTVQEFEQLKEKSLQKNETTIEIKPTKIVKKENNCEKLTNGHSNIKEKEIKVEVVSPKKESVNGGNNKTDAKPKSKGLAGFLTKSQSASSGKSSKTEDNSKMNTEQKSKNITNFFTKSNSAPMPKTNNITKASTQKPSKDIKKEDDESMDIDVTKDIPEKTVKKETEPSLNGSKKNKSLNQIKKNAKVDKKRKRVLQVSDSDSDEDPFAEDKANKAKEPESDDEIPATPATSTVKITSGILNPKKRRKIVDKTYTDEEGYILTRKEEVYESCSEEEMDSVKPESNTVKKEKENSQEPNKIKMEISPKGSKANKNNKKKISPPQKGKQATLMNFFKKV